MNRFIRFQEVKKRVALSRTTLWRMERTGNFPKRRLLSKNSVAWLEKEVEEWVLSRTTVSTTKRKESY